MHLDVASIDGDRPSRVRYHVLAVACLLALLTYINRLGFGVAAPAIQNDLELSDEQMGYLASAFLLAYALFQVPGGCWEIGSEVGTCSRCWFWAGRCSRRRPR